MQNKVLYFSEYTKENTYKVGEDGTMEAQEWYYYPDHYPEKYDLPKDLKTVWVIKYKEDKVAILSSIISEEDVKIILEQLKKEKPL